MNTDHELDRIVGDWLEARTVDPPHGSLAAALAQAERTPQQRHRWLPGWFDHGARATGRAADHDQDARSQKGRTRTMAIATVAATSVAALAISLTLVVPRLTTQPVPSVPGGTTYSVATDGGDFSTIGEALAAAQDGDTILVEPGTYEEALAIEVDVTIAGTGTRPRQTILAIPEAAPAPAADIAPLSVAVPGFEMPARPAVGVQLLGVDATLRNLQIDGRDDGLAVLVRGGSPAFEDVIVRHGGERDTNQVLAASLVVDGAAEPMVRGGQLWHRVQVDDASRLSLDSSLLQWGKLVVQGGAHLELDGVEAFAADNQPVSVVHGTADITSSSFHHGGVDVLADAAGRATVEIRDSSFDSATRDAVRVEGGAVAQLVGNTFSGNHRGVAVVGSESVVRENSFSADRTALELSESRGEYVDNTIGGGTTGIDIKDGGDPLVRGNTVQDASSRGIIIGADTSPTVDGNRLCGNMVDLFVAPGATPVLGDNEICSDEA